MSSVSLSIVSSATANRGGVPIWLANPEVRGLNEVDRKLRCRIPAGSYVYTATLDYARPVPSWQWKRDGVDIPGATDPFYLPTSADLGKAITCSVTLKGENASSVATSGSTITYTSNTPGFNDYAEISNTNVIQANTATTTVNLATTGGWKTSKTTGSMTAGSPTLTVADASGFTIGDQIIVATGGEAGGGVWGTMGVGGSTPSLYYANATARDADTSQATDTRCWLTSNGRIYRWTGSAWVADWSSTFDPFYFTRAMPKALVTTITGKSGNTLTLAANAAVNTTNANVYFDCQPLAAVYLSIYSGATHNRRLYLPTGEYAFSGKIEMLDLRDTYLEGDGATLSIMFSPDGCPSFNLVTSQAHRLVFRNFGIRGNHKLNSWGINTDFSYPRGVQLSKNYDALFMNLRSDATMNDAFVWQANCQDSVMKNVYSHHEAPIRQYLQWTLNTADSNDTSMIDCTVVSDYMVPAIEFFRSDRADIIRFTGTNAAISTNTSGAFYIGDCTQTITANSMYNFDPAMNPLTQNWWAGQPLANINTNIGNTSGSGLDLATNGGSVVNHTLTIQGFMDATYKIRNTCIIVAPTYQSVMIRGGTFTVPVSDGGNAVWGVGSDGDGVTVSRTRFVGFSAGTDYAVFARYGNIDGHGRVFACIGENFRARVSRRNQTNAQYLAAGGV